MALKPPSSPLSSNQVALERARGTLNYTRLAAQQQPRSTLTGDEAINRYDRTRDFPREATDVFPNEMDGLRRFQELIRAPHVTDLDHAYIQGDITPDELSDFLLMLPEFLQTRKDLRALAQSLTQDLGQRTLATISSSENRATELQHILRNILIAITSQCARNVRCVRNQLIDTFCTLILEDLIEILLEAEDNGDLWMNQSYEAQQARIGKLLDKKFSQSNGVTPKDISSVSAAGHRTIRWILSNYFTNYRKASGRDAPGFHLFANLTNFRRIPRDHKQEIKQLIWNGDPTEKDLPVTTLQEQGDALFRDISELAYIAPIASAKKNVNGVIIEIVGNDSKILQRRRHSVLFFIRLQFPSGKPILLDLDQSTGDLYWHDTHTSIQHVFGQPFYRMRKRILETVLSHVQDPQSMIIPEIIQKAPTPTEPESQMISMPPAVTEDSVVTDNAADPEVFSPTTDTSLQQEHDPIIFDLSSDTLASISEVLVTEEEARAQCEENRMARQHLRGLKGFRVRDTLNTLLGAPRTQGGGSSHCIYTGRNGSSIMIALHADDVPAGFLRQFLRRAGISIEEFIGAY